MGGSKRHALIVRLTETRGPMLNEVCEYMELRN